MLMNSLVELKDVTAGYPGHIALKEVSFKVDYKEAIAVVGPNGGGKSTLMKVLMGLLDPLKGEVKVLGEKPYKNRHIKSKVSYLSQQSAINPNFPALIEDIVKLGLFTELGLIKRTSKEQKLRIIKALEKVDMKDMIGEPYEHLSGGQKQRVLIARALVSRPAVMLLDEPTTGLDLSSQQAILKIIKDLSDNEKLTIVAVTHDQIFLKNWAKRIIRIEQTLTFDGVAEDYFRGEA